jgi:nitrilase
MMLLPGYALMAQGTQVHVAGWPGWEPAEAPRGGYLWPRQALLSRAFAAQGACWVLCVGGLRRREDVPERFRALCGPDMTGDSLVIDPRGEVIAGPAEGETILVVDVSLEAVAAAKAVCDVAGHYARPDVFQVRVDGEPIGRVMPAQAEAMRRGGALGQSHPEGAHASPEGAGEVQRQLGSAAASDLRRPKLQNLVDTS